MKPGQLNINVDSIDELSAVPTLGAGPGGLQRGYQTGTQGYVGSTARTYVLKVSNDPVDGVTVLATRDDSERQWVAIGGGSGTGTVESVTAVADCGIIVDNSDPTNPVLDVDPDAMADTIGLQDPNNVAITGGSITGVTIEGAPRAGTALTNADQTIQPGTSAISQSVQPASAPLTAARVKTIGVTSAVQDQLYQIVRKDTGAFNMTFVNGGTNAGTIGGVVLPPATADYYTARTFFYNGVDWVSVGFAYLAVV